MLNTKEKGTQYEHSLDHAVEFFSKAGSAMEKTKHFYSDAESALSLFQKTWIVDKEISMKLLLWLRDCRGGAGNRSGFKICLRWLCQHDPKWVSENIVWVPMIGRWDDLRSCYGTVVEETATQLWQEGLKDPKTKVLAAKWADRKDIQLRKRFNFDEATFRKFLSKIRKNHIVEAKMCSNRWEEIDYDTVPSVAMARYTNAFKRHDLLGFTSFKEKLKTGEKKVHASVLFPHDCVRTVFNGDREIGDAQFEALPNYLEGVDDKIMVISDTSGSMSSCVSGSIQAVHVSIGMALYCSARYPEDSPFYKKFIGFESEASYKNWDGYSFSSAVKSRRIFDGAVGATRIDRALLTILETAKFWNLTQEQIPNVLLIVSDMQFHHGVEGDGTEVDKCIKLWNEAGYESPKIVYWNTSSYGGSPGTVNSNNIGLVSGFSPSILKAIFGGQDFSPRGIMLRALEKYTIKVP